MATTRKPARRPRRTLRPRTSRSNPDWKRIWSDVKRAARQPPKNSPQQRILLFVDTLTNEALGSASVAATPLAQENLELASKYVNAVLQGHTVAFGLDEEDPGVAGAEAHLRRAISALEKSSGVGALAAHAVAARLNFLARPALWALYGAERGAGAALEHLVDLSNMPRINPSYRRAARRRSY